MALIPRQRMPTMGDLRDIRDAISTDYGDKIDFEFRVGLNDLEWRFRCIRDNRRGPWEHLVSAVLNAQSHMVLAHELEGLL